MPASDNIKNHVFATKLGNYLAQVIYSFDPLQDFDIHTLKYQIWLVDIRDLKKLTEYAGFLLEDSYDRLLEMRSIIHVTPVDNNLMMLATAYLIHQRFYIMQSHLYDIINTTHQERLQLIKIQTPFSFFSNSVVSPNKLYNSYSNEDFMNAPQQ